MTETKTEEKQGHAVEEIAAEIERLEGQLQAARRKEAEAGQGLAALEPRRRDISVAVVADDPGAHEELRALAHRRAELEMSVEAARDAQGRLEGLLREAEARREEARLEGHRRRRDALLAEADELALRAEELARELAGVLERQAALRGDALQELLRAGEHGRANSELASLRDSNRAWVRERFGVWLG